MQAFSELPSRQKRVEVMRWVLLVPAAVLAASAVELIVGGVARAAGSGGPVPWDPGSVGFWVRAVPYYVLPQFAFVVAGGRLAPRKQLAVAVLLVLVGGLLSLLKHVVGQHLAGNSVGFVNYAHFGLELSGLVAGAAFLRVRTSGA